MLDHRGTAGRERPFLRPSTCSPTMSRVSSCQTTLIFLAYWNNSRPILPWRKAFMIKSQYHHLFLLLQQLPTSSADRNPISAQHRRSVRQKEKNVLCLSMNKQAAVNCRMDFRESLATPFWRESRSCAVVEMYRKFLQRSYVPCLYCHQNKQCCVWLSRFAKIEKC